MPFRRYELVKYGPNGIVDRWGQGDSFIEMRGLLRKFYSGHTGNRGLVQVYIFDHETGFLYDMVGVAP